MKPEKDNKATMQKDGPAHEIRLGAIKATIWENETERGVRYNTTFARIYRDEDSWRSTDSFGRDDLLLLAKVADSAHTWTFQQTLNAGHVADEQAVAT